MAKAGNIIVFGADEGGMIINKEARAITQIDEEGQAYTPELWVKPGPDLNEVTQRRLVPESVMAESLLTRRRQSPWLVFSNPGDEETTASAKVSVTTGTHLL